MTEDEVQEMARDFKKYLSALGAVQDILRVQSLRCASPMVLGASSRLLAHDVDVWEGALALSERMRELQVAMERNGETTVEHYRFIHAFGDDIVKRLPVYLGEGAHVPAAL